MIISNPHDFGVYPVLSDCLITGWTYLFGGHCTTVRFNNVSYSESIM